MICLLTLSTVVFCRQTIFALPMSPLVENFTPSFVTDITTKKREEKLHQTSGMGMAMMIEIRISNQHMNLLHSFKE